MGADLEKTPQETRDVVAIDTQRALQHLRVLCIGNGGMIRRDGRSWTHRSMATFLAETAMMVREVCFCAWLDPEDDPLADTSAESLRGVRARALPRFDGGAWTKWSNGVIALAQLAREVVRSDFVYLYWPGRLSSIAARICRALGKPYGIYFRGEQIPPDPSLPATLAQARFTLTTGESLGTVARTYCRDVEYVTPMTSLGPDDLRDPRPPKQDAPCRLLFVGRIEERKGVFELLKAMSYLEHWGVPFELTLIGHCYDPARVEAELTPAVAKHVRFVGVVSDFAELTRHYLESNMLVVPSHDEGFPRVLYEAMALGVPILTTFVGSVETLMVDRTNCLRIDVRNPRDIAEKVRELVADPELGRVITASASRDIRELMSTWRRSHAVQVAERLLRLV